jgi:threonine dehydratase
MSNRRDIEAASARLQGWVRRTPVEEAPTLGPGVWLKCENQQVTGSFKIRGATNAMLTLPEETRSRGVVTASSGNHGLGVARAATKLGIPATVFVPNEADDGKTEAIRRMGVPIERVGDDCLHTEQYARLIASKTGRAYLSPYNDHAIIAGQGTIGVEMVEQIPGLDAVFIAIGGGGLISGVGAYLKAVAPNVEVVGCSPAASPAMHRCLEAGEIIDVPCRATLSGATAGGVEPGAITFDICRMVVDRTVLVGEAHIADAMRHIISTHHMLIEGAAGVAVAGYQQLANEYQNKTVGIVLCGANISTIELTKILAG